MDISLVGRRRALAVLTLLSIPIAIVVGRTYFQLAQEKPDDYNANERWVALVAINAAAGFVLSSFLVWTLAASQAAATQQTDLYSLCGATLGAGMVGMIGSLFFTPYILFIAIVCIGFDLGRSVLTKLQGIIAQKWQASRAALMGTPDSAAAADPHRRFFHLAITLAFAATVLIYGIEYRDFEREVRGGASRSSIRTTFSSQTATTLGFASSLFGASQPAMSARALVPPFNHVGAAIVALNLSAGLLLGSFLGFCAAHFLSAPRILQLLLCGLGGWVAFGLALDMAPFALVAAAGFFPLFFAGQSGRSAAAWARTARRAANQIDVLLTEIRQDIADIQANSSSEAESLAFIEDLKHQERQLQRIRQLLAPDDRS